MLAEHESSLNIIQMTGLLQRFIYVQGDVSTQYVYDDFSLQKIGDIMGYIYPHAYSVKPRPRIIQGLQVKTQFSFSLNCVIHIKVLSLPFRLCEIPEVARSNICGFINQLS